LGQGDRVKRAETTAGSRSGQVDRRAFLDGAKRAARGLFQFLGRESFQFVLIAVERPFFVGRKRRKVFRFGEVGDTPLLSQVFYPNRFKGLGAFRFRQIAYKLFF
jgi:hypothetical protein